MSRIAKLVESTVGQIADDPVTIPTISQEDLDEAAASSAQLATLIQKANALHAADRTTGVIQMSLEDLHTSLTGMNNEGGLTVDQFKLAQLALESHTQTLEIKPIGLGVGLEAFDEGAKSQVSLEELEGVLEVVDANHEALAQDQSECSMELVDLIKTAVPAAAYRLSAVLARAEADGAKDNTDETVPAGDIAYAFADGDSFPSDFPAYMAKYIDYGKKLAGPFMADVGKAAAEAMKFENVSFESPEAFEETVQAAYNAEVDPRKHFTDEDYEVCLPGDGPLFADSEACGVEGIFKPIDVAAHERQPVNPGDFDAEQDEPLPEAIPCLSVEQILSVGKALHALAMECDTPQFEEDSCDSTQALDKVITAFAQKFDGAPDEVADKIGCGAQVVIEYLTTINTMARWTPIYFLTNLINTINAFNVYAERSLSKEPIAVSTENLSENISMEGDPFKLRTGMKVRYSGGYGRIVKIMDRPMVYKGKHYHGSKMNPHYEVKGEVGGKLTLHKASALTPAP
jgi:hypothetical protein